MYSKGELIEFLEYCFGEYKSYNNGENIAFYCPNCKDIKTNKRKLVIRTNDLVYQCWKCGIKGRNIYFVLKQFKPYNISIQFKEKFLNNKELYYKQDISNNDILTLPKDFLLLAEFKNDYSKEIRNALSYLKSRGATEKDLWYYKFGITNSDIRYKDRIIIPSFDWNGDLNFFLTRTYKPNILPKYINCDIQKTEIIFNEININWNEELVIVEGPFNLIKLPTQNTTCMLGSTLNEDYLLFQKIVENNTDVILVHDPDAYDKMVSTARKLLKYNIKVKIVGKLPDGYKDVGEMKKEDVSLLISGAKSYNNMDYLKYKIERL